MSKPNKKSIHIHLGTDHAGFELKEKVKTWLSDEGYGVIDHGAYAYDETDDYPHYIAPVAKAVSEAVLSGELSVRGVIFGGSGQGEAMAANRFPRVRAALYYGSHPRIVSLSREHNNANILSLGARFISFREARGVVTRWLSTDFSQEERHSRRIGEVDKEAIAYWGNNPDAKGIIIRDI